LTNVSSQYVSFKNLLLFDLQASTTYSVNIVANYDSINGVPKSSFITPEPIVFTTDQLSTGYVAPTVIEYNYASSATDLSETIVTFKILNPDNVTYNMIPTIDNGGSITLSDSSSNSVIDNYTYNVKTEPAQLSSLSWKIEPVYDRTADFDYYGDNSITFYNNLINPSGIVSNEQTQKMGAQGYLVYQSPANGNYYPLVGHGGYPPNHPDMIPFTSGEVLDSSNFLLDSNGNVNPNYVRLKAPYQCAGSTPKLSGTVSHRNNGLFFLGINGTNGNCNSGSDN